MRRRLPFAIALVAVTLTALPARADDTSELEGLLDESVVTTATKSAEVEATAPGISTTITAEDLRRYGIHSLDEAIDFLSLGAVTSNPLKAVDIGARGVLLPNDSGDHFLLLVNGHRLNEPLFGSARFERGLGIPFEMVDHIEVVLGPGSVLYGSNAMLGVINVITKKAKDWNGAHVVGETEVGKSYRALGGLGLQQLEILGKPAWLTMGLEYYQQDGPSMVYGYNLSRIDPASLQPYKYRRDGPANGIWGGLAKNAYYSRVPSAVLRLQWGDFELNAAAKMYKRAVPYRGRYKDDFIDFDDPDSYEVDRHVWVDLTHRVRLSPIVLLTNRLYADSWDNEAIRNSSEASACLSAGDSKVPTCQFYSPSYSRWAGLEVRAAFDWLKDERLVTTIGADNRVRTAALKIDGRDFATGQPLRSTLAYFDHHDLVFGPYLQQTWLPTRWLSLNGGARFNSENYYTGVVTPRFAASAATWKGGTLKGIYAEAFRAPAFIETELQDPIQLKSQDLRPERVRSVEASVEQRIGAQRLLVGVFRSWWKDMIEQHVLTQAEAEDAVRRGEISLLNIGVAQFQNVSSIDNYGINAAYEGSIGSVRRLRYALNVTAAITKKTQPDGTVIDELPVAPAYFGNARISYDLGAPWPTLAVAAHHLARRPVDRAYDGGWAQIPYANAQTEIRGTVTGSIPFVKGLLYRVSANATLASHNAYVVGPAQQAEPLNPVPQLVPVDPFRVTVGLQWDFGQ